MNSEESLILYILMFFTSSVMLSLYKKYERHRLIRKCIFLVAIAFPILILGMRYYVGTDYENYLSMYERYKDIPISDIFLASAEILNVLLCKLIYSIHDNKYIFILVYAVLTIIISFKAILNINSKNTFLITFMYLCLFFPLATNGVRQSLAIAIILYAYTLLFKDIKKFSVLIIIAFLVHSSALIVLPAGIICYAIKDIKSRNCVLIGFYGMLIIMLVVGVPFASSNVFLQKLLGYMEVSGEVEFGIGVLILNLPIFLLSMFFYSRIGKKEENYSTYIALFVLSIMFSYLGYINISLNRFAYYFSILQIFLIPKGLDMFKDNGIRRILEMVFVIVMLYQFVNDTYVKGHSDIFPYDFIEISDFEKEGS